MKSPLFFSIGMIGLTLALIQPDAHAQIFGKRSRPAPIPVAYPAEAPGMAPPSLATMAPAGPTPSAPLPLAETVLYTQPPSAPRSYELPYTGYAYKRHAKSGFKLFASSTPSKEMLELLNVIRSRAETISSFHLSYVFGGDHPEDGGLDCSATMKYLLSDIGFRDMPRTSYQQYAWLKSAKTIRHTKTIPERMGGRKGIKPGDLIFWGGTYDSGHKVSHVMIYLGQGQDGTHYMFGARGKNKTGLHGSGVDIFKLDSGHQKGLIGYGSLPGVS